MERLVAWLDQVDPGGRRRIRGLRLAAVFAVASMAGVLSFPGPRSLDAAAMAGNCAIWSSLYEAAATRRRASADLLLFIAAAALGAISSAVWSWIVGFSGSALALLPLAGGAFLVGYAKRWGPLGTGIGGLAFIGQALAVGLRLTPAFLPMIAAAALIAAGTAILLRVLGGPSERDADALSRCQDLRRIMAGRLRRYHDALHRDDAAALMRVLPKSTELAAAWAALDKLVAAEFTGTDLIAGYLHTEIRRLYALMETVLNIGDSLSQMQAALPDIRGRAAIGLALHALRSIVLQDAESAEPALVKTLRLRSDRLIRYALAGPESPFETRIALLRLGLAIPHAIALDPAAAPVKMTPRATPAMASRGLLPTTRVAAQCGVSALLIIAITDAIGMRDVLWALAASTWVLSSSVAETWSRGLRRIAGTAVGVALGLGMAMLFAQTPLMVWAMAALAMIVYSTWLQTRYDVACGAYAFALVVTLAEAGNSSWDVATGRGLNTVLGAVIGMAISVLVLPVRLRDQLREALATLLTEVRDQVAASLTWITTGRHGAAPYDTGATLMAMIEAEKARFAGLRVEGILSRDGDGGTWLLLRLDALVAVTMRLLRETELAANRIDPIERGRVADLAATLHLAFDAVLERLRRQDRPPVSMIDIDPLPLFAHAAKPSAHADGLAGALLATAFAYTSHKITFMLAELAAELDRRDGVLAIKPTTTPPFPETNRPMEAGST